MIVLDPGPIPYAEIALAGDADLEVALCRHGLEPETTAYRLVEIALADARLSAQGRRDCARL